MGSKDKRKFARSKDELIKTVQGYEELEITLWSVWANVPFYDLRKVKVDKTI